MKFSLLIIIICFIYPVTFYAQCPTDYYTKTFSSSNGFSISKTVYNSQQEIGLAGSSSSNSAFRHVGLISKLSDQGTPIWTKHYAIPGFRMMTFTDIVALNDGGFIVVGFYDDVDTVTHLLKKGWGIVMRVDRFGNPKWTKSLSNFNEAEDITNLLKIERLSGGDYILFGNTFKKPTANTLARAPQLIIRMNESGDVIWRTSLHIQTDNVPLGNPSLLELSNGNLQFGFNLFQQQKSGPGEVYKEGYCLMQVNNQTGIVNEQKFYTYPTMPAIVPASMGRIVLINEFTNGNLGFHFSFSDTAFLLDPPHTKRCAIMITDAFGNIQRVNGYYNGSYGCAFIDGLIETNRDRLLLIDDGNTPVLARVDENENFTWQFSLPAAGYVPVSLLKINEGYNIFSTNWGSMHLTKIDNNTQACEKNDIVLTREDITPMFTPWNISIHTVTGDEVMLPTNLLYLTGTITSQLLCTNTCCTDIINGNVISAEICEGDTYQLPTNELVRDSGMYYVRYQSQGGCDSIQYFHLKVIKNPDQLKLTGEQCLETTDTIRLSATDGFENYNWMGVNSTDSIKYISSPGTYWVSVQNNCGTNADSIIVYDKCEFDIFIPSAFTPNGDKLNDDFGIPAQNNNKLIKLEIYNRWGKKVFETNDKLKRWDGTYKEQRQPQGVYVYFIVMETLAGKTLTKKGSLTLIL